MIDHLKKNMPIKVTDAKEIVLSGRLLVVTKRSQRDSKICLGFSSVFHSSFSLQKYMQASTLMRFGTFY